MPTDAMLINQLFQQSADQHKENRVVAREQSDMLGEIKDALSDMRRDHALVGQRLSIVEAWRIIEADPSIQRLKAIENQFKGGSRVMRAIRDGVMILGGGTVATCLAPIARWVGLVH